jgi:FAD/FMN-containing dehydrogenase
VTDARDALLDVRAETTLAAAEAEAAGLGMTIAPPTPGSQGLTLRGFLEGAHAGLRVGGGGRLEPMAVAVRARFPDGETFGSRLTPRRAAGPDVLHLILGCSGRFATVEGATLRLLPLPASAATVRRRFSTPAEALAALRTLAVEGAPIQAAFVDGGRLGLALAGLRSEVARAAGGIAGAADEGTLPPGGTLEAAVRWDELGAALAACGNRAMLARVSQEGAVICADESAREALSRIAAPLDGPPRLGDFERRLLDRVGEAMGRGRA